ncbi:hypothetical protein FRC09_002330 [Ceratobasidium sp. 395]|nr:hypothetical protein FRC09_002330 [Ceratobasidium sp. 395]
MVDLEKPDILSAMSSLRLSENKCSADDVSDSTMISSIGGEVPIDDHIKKEEQEPTLPTKEGCEKLKLLGMIRSQLGNTRGKPGLRIDCCTKLLAETPSSTPIESPAAKGGYTIGPAMVDTFLGKCMYFVAPVETLPNKTEHLVFSISANNNIVSSVDNSGQHSDSTSFVSKFYDSCYIIGARVYFWEARGKSLSWTSADCQTGGPVVLHDELDDARSESRLMNDSLAPGGQPIGNTIPTGSRTRPSSQVYDPGEQDCPPQTQNNQALFGSLNGHEQGNDLIMLSPSPPDTSTQSSDPSQTTTRSDSEQTLMFGKQARKDDIDDWVNKAVESRKWSTPGGGIKCPESGFHVCGGCKAEFSGDTCKRHKKTCVKLLRAQSSGKKSLTV